MANFRIVYPSDFKTQQSRFITIYDKDKADGNASEIYAFKKEKSMDMTKMKAAADSALTYENTRKSYKDISVAATEVRDHHFEDVWKFTTSSFQYLKKFYKGDMTKLLAWGAPVVGGTKLVYPSKFLVRKDIFDALVAKHTTMGAGSILTAYITKNNVDLPTLIQHAADAVTANKTSDDNAMLSEDMKQKRDLAWKPVWKAVVDISGFLGGLYETNKKGLVVWGIVVDDSPRAPKERVSKVKPEETKKSNGIVNGSTFTNTGNTELHVYPGSSTKGNPNIVGAGEQLNMGKGFSTITVVNVDKLVAGSFKVLVTKHS